jgi:putative ABC transport system permease protein
MFGYYCNLALRSFRRNRALTVLMVLAIALGIGASMTALTVFHVLAGDPIPSKSDRLFYVQLDSEPMSSFHPGDEPTPQLTRYDAETLLKQGHGQRQALMSAGAVAIEPDTAGMAPFMLHARYASADFFPMFEVALRSGRGWTAADDAAHARVAVVSQALSEKLYGGRDPVGRILRLGSAEFRVLGVVAGDWNPNPRFYDLTNDQFGEPEDVYLPFSTARDLKLGTSGSLTCWGDLEAGQDGHGLHDDCAWLQYWVELASPAQAADFRAYLGNYSDQQRAAGRFQRPTNVRLHDVMGWLDRNQVVPSDVRLQAWLALGFLGVCLLNTVGLLLAKFLRRRGEIGVRRALGASRRQIFVQCLVEAGMVGMAGGVLGLGLALGGLWLVRQQPADYATMAHLDLPMLLATLALSLLGSLLAGAFPAWRAMQVAPALQLKSQ